MKEKIFLLYLVVSTILITIVGVTTFLLTPEKKVEVINSTSSKNIEEIITSSLDIKVNSISINLNLDENIINEIILASKKVDNSRVFINDGDIEIYTNYSLLKIFPTQIKVVLKATIEKNMLSLQVKKAFIGRLTIDPSKILKSIEKQGDKNIEFDYKNNKIHIKNEMFKFNEINVGDKNMFLSLSINKSKVSDSFEKGIDMFNSLFN